MTPAPAFAILIGANQTRSETMATQFTLPHGDHEIIEQAVGWIVRYRDAHPPQVTVIASIESGPRQTTAPSQGQTATSLAIHMDARVAIDLYQRLGNLARSMGWQLPP
jgi:hypothetical protein